eukprot:Trichotokara_eunicae@DN8953_c0_g1_i1.p1
MKECTFKPRKYSTKGEFPRLAVQITDFAERQRELKSKFDVHIKGLWDDSKSEDGTSASDKTFNVLREVLIIARECYMTVCESRLSQMRVDAAIKESGFDLDLGEKLTQKLELQIAKIPHRKRPKIAKTKRRPPPYNRENNPTTTCQKTKLKKEIEIIEPIRTTSSEELF